MSGREPLWLCLHFAQLALDVFHGGDDNRGNGNGSEDDSAHDDSARPLAVIERRVVHCANRDNLPAGLALATAQALYPDLLALERQPEREREHLQQLAHWAYQFTPGVAIAPRNSLLLEIGSCRRLYRGAHRLLKMLRRSLRQRRQAAHFGLAHTPKAAWLLAHCGSEPALHGDRVDASALRRQLAAIPVAVLDIDDDTRQSLDHMGIATLGALQRLPAAALGKRFGAHCIDYLQKLAGAVPDPQAFFTPLPCFQHGLAFIDGVAHRDMLLFPMKRLLQMLDDYLRARQLQGHALQWRLCDAHRVQAEFSVELSRAQNRWPTLLELSRLKLEQITLSASVFAIHLTCEKFFEAIPAPQQLFPDHNDRSEAAAALIDRLRARVGNTALQHIAARSSHWPELAWRALTPVAGAAKNALNDESEQRAASLAQRPLWLLPKPQPLSGHDDQPCWPTPLALLRGPERIGNHWWQEEAAERDYYVARNERGVICWIYRDRVTQRWYLHGLFA